MLTAVPRTDNPRLVERVVPPSDPAEQGVQEGEGGWTVWCAGVLMCLGHFSPGASSVGAMNND